MTKHIVDRDHTSGAAEGRKSQYVRIERDQVPSEPSKHAQREARSRGDNGRLRAFTKIEREEG